MARYIEYIFENGLSLNVDKTLGLCFRANNRRSKVEQNGEVWERTGNTFAPHTLRIGGELVSFVERVRFLGVHFSSDGDLENMYVILGGEPASSVCDSVRSNYYYFSRVCVWLCPFTGRCSRRPYRDLWRRAVGTCLIKRVAFYAAQTVLPRMFPKGMGLTRRVPAVLVYLVCGRPPLCYQLWQRRILFFRKSLNGPVNGS